MIRIFFLIILFLSFTLNCQAKMLYLNDFSDGNKDADFALGSATMTYTGTNGTYIDKYGVMQLASDNTPRFNYGYYDATGFTAHQGSYVSEVASTNYVLNSYFSIDTNADGLSDNWTSAKGTPTRETCFINGLTNGKSQKVSHTYAEQSVENQYWIRTDTPDDSFDASGGNITATISFWARADFSGILDNRNNAFSFRAMTNGGTSTREQLWNPTIAHMITLGISSTIWKKFTYTATITNTESRICSFRIFNVSDVSYRPTTGESAWIEVYGVQIEKQSTASTFIPTTTTVVTRTADVAKFETAGNRSASVEACVVKFRPFGTINLIGNRYITDSDTKRRIFDIENLTNDVYISANYTDNSTCQVTDLINDTWTANSLLTLGYNIQQTSPYIAGFYNGAADGTNETTDSFTANAWGTYWYLGCNSGGALQLNGSIEMIAFFDDAKEAAEFLEYYNNNVVVNKFSGVSMTGIEISA